MTFESVAVWLSVTCQAFYVVAFGLLISRLGPGRPLGRAGDVVMIAGLSMLIPTATDIAYGSRLSDVDPHYALLMLAAVTIKPLCERLKVGTDAG
jgi:hypothetical protein